MQQEEFKTRHSFHFKILVCVVFGAFYGYAFMRYHVGKQLWEWGHVPYVLNKAIAWTGASLLVGTLLPNRLLFTKGWTRKTFGAVGFRWILVHIFCTLALLGEKLYPKMFNDQQLNSMGWVAIAFGIAAFVCFSLPWYATIRKIPPPHVLYKFGRIGVLCAVGHATALGISGWTSTGQWPFLMPPITLIFVVFALFVVVYRYVFCGYRQKEQP